MSLQPKDRLKTIIRLAAGVGLKHPADVVEHIYRIAFLSRKLAIRYNAIKANSWVNSEKYDRLTQRNEDVLIKLASLIGLHVKINRRADRPIELWNNKVIVKLGE